MKIVKRTLAAMLVTPLLFIVIPVFADQYEVLERSLTGINEGMPDDMPKGMSMIENDPECLDYMPGRDIRNMRRRNMGYMNGPDTDYWHKRNMGSMRRSNIGHMPGKNMGHMQGWDMPRMSRRNMHDRRGMDSGHMHDMQGMPMIRMMNQRHVMMQEHMARMEESLDSIKSLLQQLVEQQNN